ncbi:MAG: phosphatidylserine decarboxylase family protein [Chitinophagales bacterium]
MKYKLHREGRYILIGWAIGLLLLNILLQYAFSIPDWITTSVLIFSIVLYLGMLSFFRIPQLVMEYFDNALVIAPAEGKIVVIEEVEEKEYFKDRRIQVSIFMSPANVHVNRSPISGTVKYTKYHPGAYLVAWHPKSSELNERFTSVIESADSEIEVLVRQIAGKLARKISNYLTEGTDIEQGEELGFIKFGSRVDIFLPLDAEIKVSLNQKVKGGETVIAELK